MDEVNVSEWWAVVRFIAVAQLVLDIAVIDLDRDDCISCAADPRLRCSFYTKGASGTFIENRD